MANSNEQDARHPRLSSSYRLLVRPGVGLAFAFALFRTVIVAPAVAGEGDFSGYFLVLGRISRHGCVFIVSLKSAMFGPTGARSRMVDFSFSEESRKFCSVTLMLSFSVRLLVIVSKLFNDSVNGPSGAVRSTR